MKGGHGTVTLPKAIYQSCDTYFYTLAERLGIGRIAKYATMFGLGQKTGIDLPQEVSGVMPSEEWKIKNYKQKWFAGETISVGIGQGAVATTPVQLMRAVGAITSDGIMRRPHVAFPDQLPPQYLQMVNYTEETRIPIDSVGWTTITDGLGRRGKPYRHGAKRTSERHRLCRQDWIGANHFQRHESQGVQQSGLQG